MTTANQSLKDIFSQLEKAGGIIRLQGKPFVTFKGLLWIAHMHGLESIETDMVYHDPKERSAVFKATVRGKRGSFSDYGDASPDNVSGLIKKACIRMASTRAQARALRQYLGIGLCSLEELPEPV